MRLSFDKKTVFCGDSEEEFNRVRNVLEKNHIPYKYKAVDREGNTGMPGRGTTRSMGGNWAKTKLIYEVTVSKENYELAYLKLYK